MTNLRRIVLEHRRAVYILAAALVINAALYGLVVYPLAQRVQSGEQEAGDATRALNTARRTFEAARGTVTGKREADAELAKFYQDVLPATFSAARGVLYPHLDQLARKANLSVGGSRFTSDKDVALGNLRKVTMTMNLTGEYSDIRRFIHDLETAAEFLVLESVSVTSTTDNDRQLNVQTQVATYYRTSEHGN